MSVEERVGCDHISLTTRFSEVVNAATIKFSRFDGFSKTVETVCDVKVDWRVTLLKQGVSEILLALASGIGRTTMARNK